jgi:hypothetical protein
MANRHWQCRDNGDSSILCSKRQQSGKVLSKPSADSFAFSRRQKGYLSLVIVGSPYPNTNPEKLMIFTLAWQSRAKFS